MSRVTVKIEGLEELSEKFGSKIPTAIKNGAKRGVELSSFGVEGRAKMYCPVDTGLLRESNHVKRVTMSGGKLNGGVLNNTEYAMFVEFGTGVRGMNSNYPYSEGLALTYSPSWKGQKAQPFLGRALYQSKELIAKTVRNKIAESLKGLK